MFLHELNDTIKPLPECEVPARQTLLSTQEHPRLDPKTGYIALNFKCSDNFLLLHHWMFDEKSKVMALKGDNVQ